MEKFDMGDAFVGAWDIANLVSDFLMEKMGAETSGCSTKAPTSLSSSRYAAVLVLQLNSGGQTRATWHCCSDGLRYCHRRLRIVHTSDRQCTTSISRLR